METQAEIASSADSAKVDSAAQDAGTEVSATSATETGAAETKGAAGTESPQKKGDDGQERFDKLTRDLYELRGEIDRGRYDREARDKRIAELEAELGTAKQSQVAPDNLPTLESVGYDEQKFVSALSAHFEKIAEKQGSAAAEKALQRYQAQQNQQSTQTAWAKREADFIKSQPDYVDKVQKATTLPISQEIQQALMQMDDGPQLAHYLVENRDKALAMMRMPPQFQMMELGRIQGELASKKLKPPVSQAPPPVAKVDATDAPAHFKVDTGESDQLSDAEWTRRRNAQELARRKKANS